MLGLVQSDKKLTNAVVRKHLVAGQVNTNRLTIQEIPIDTYIQSLLSPVGNGSCNVIVQNFPLMTSADSELTLRPRGYYITDQDTSPAIGSYINDNYIDNTNGNNWIVRVSGKYNISFTASTKLQEGHTTQTYTTFFSVNESSSTAFASTGGITNNDVNYTMMGSIIVDLQENDSFYLVFINSLSDQSIVFYYSSLNVTFLSR